MLPEDFEAESHAISWASFIASTIHPARRKGIDHPKTVFGIAHKRPGDDQWALGQYSIADIHLFRLFWRFRNSVHPAASDFPSLSAHYEPMMARPAVQRTLEIEVATGYELPA